MANQTVYPYGQGGSLPSGYPIADDLNTNSAQQALAAKQGVVLRKKTEDIDNGIIHPPYTMTSGSISTDGSIGTSANYSYTSAISLKKGQKITVYSQGYGYAAISQYATPYVPLVTVPTNPGTGVYVTSTYVAPNDMQVACCVRSANDYDIYIDGMVKDVARKEAEDAAALDDKIDKVTEGAQTSVMYVADVSKCSLLADGTQCAVDKTTYDTHRVVFFPVESNKYYKIHVASTKPGRVWGWTDSYVSASPGSETNLGGLIGEDVTEGGVAFDIVLQNTGNYSYIAVYYTSNTGGVTCKEYVPGKAVSYSAQGNTKEAMATARKNIGALGEEANNRIRANYIVGNGQTISYINLYGLIHGHRYRVYIRNQEWSLTGISGDSYYKFQVRNDYQGDTTTLVGVYVPDTVKPYYDFLVPVNSDYVRIAGRAAVGEKIEFEVEDVTDEYIGWHDQTIFSINHRGYSTVAPENTIPAFILSKKRGFAYVETDVAFTSDDVAVLMHDETINRTARNPDGTEISGDINIYDITYAQAKEYDYGIWMGAKWAGTQIPTFEEFIVACKQLSLHPFIELKDSITWTNARCDVIAAAIRKVGMERNVSFISFDANALAYITTLFPEATIGLGFKGVYSDANITTFANTAAGLKTATNRVLASVKYSSMTTYRYTILANAGVNSIVWTVNSVSDATNLNTNTVGVLSDSLNAGSLICGELMATLPPGV